MQYFTTFKAINTILSTIIQYNFSISLKHIMSNDVNTVMMSVLKQLEVAGAGPEISCDHSVTIMNSLAAFYHLLVALIFYQARGKLYSPKNV